MNGRDDSLLHLRREAVGLPAVVVRRFRFANYEYRLRTDLAWHLSRERRVLGASASA